MRGNYYIAFLLIIWLNLPVNLAAQRIARAKNIGIGIENNRALISYDLRSDQSTSRHSVQLKFLDKQYNLITPTSLSGDVGANIPSGSSKTIEWDITRDFDLLGSDVTPILFVDGISKEFNRPGGSGYAALSLLLPGLGDYFVADHRMMNFKPYLRTLSSLGLIGLGIYAGQQRYRSEGEYVRVLKANSWRFTGDDRFKYVYQEGDMNYWLFKGDQELFITMGALIWVYDIVWVLVKGSNNKKFLEELSQGSTFKLSYYEGGLNLRYAITF